MSQIAAREREKNRTVIVGGPEASYRERDRAGMLETLEYFRELAHAFRSFPGLTLLGAAGLVTVAVAFDRSKAGMQGAEILFWLGLLILVIPFTIRLAMPGLDRSERIAAVLFLGMGLYLVKVMQNPLAFAYPDEYVHLFNVDQIRSTGHLFTPNPLIAVTSLYPGLAIVTSALADMTGLSSFHAGLVIIGAARLLLLLGLFFLFEEVSGSARVAGLGALAYAANPNFLFFNSQYAYESLALPLAVLLVSLVLTRLNTTDAAANLGLGVVTVLLVSTVVISHHVTAIALTGFLFALSAAYWFFYRGRVQKPILLALFALVAVLGWLLFVASATLGYLAPLFANAGASFGKLLAGLGVPRALFSSTSGYVPAFPERGIAIGGVLLTVAALPFGLLELWRKYRRSAAAWILAAAGVGYIFTLGLRLFPAAWEIGNRASEFLFIGVGFLLALAVAWLAGHAHASFARRAILGAAFAVIFAAGVIAGWPPLARLALPNFAEADQRTLNPEGIAAGTWARNYLLPGQIFAADPSNARPLVTLGNQVALTGSERGIRAMIYADRIDKSVIEILARAQVRYVLVDRRLKSWDQMVGLAFDHAGQNTALLPASAADKFDLPARVRRIYDSGDIVIYDVGDLTGVVPVQ